MKVELLDVECISNEIKEALEDFLDERVEGFEIQGNQFLVYLKEAEQ